MCWWENNRQGRRVLVYKSVCNVISIIDFCRIAGDSIGSRRCRAPNLHRCSVGKIMDHCKLHRSANIAKKSVGNLSCENFYFAHLIIFDNVLKLCGKPKFQFAYLGRFC